MSRTTVQRVSVFGRELDVSNLDKPLWPADGLTKADLIQYVASVAHLLLPHLAGRPLSATRYPDGIEGKWFYQKDCPDYAPDWIETYPVISKERDKVTKYILPNEPATLVWLANQAAIELHPWMSLASSPSVPDYSVIDLDPAEGATFDDVRLIARLVKEVLDSWGLEGFPKISGATGIHIYVPLQPKYTYDISSRFAGLIGRIIANAVPSKATNERLVKNRKGRVYVDHLQNLPGKTIVAPYCPRPLPAAPVSLPFLWEELDTIHPSQFSIADPQSILARPNPFQHLYQRRQSIDHLLDQLGPR